ncbi:MAG: Hsp20 family protein [Methanoculleus sp.]|uniref:Hsp20/alpha crystallin family protein n=1 Tax=Methanoculleus sp. TaxID=90427 RepID=UPI0025F73797|nr:Hsp20 family protein [Methanoculleus sp.]MCK9318390.1 Hsp20 family protein [Methanoculleus sp.]MDD2254431.1 Hsp20 family protein [Methanoculleus sp.]MDD3216892.1 Hsp20 family protein [Methanoculleus sp.]MDD4314958.1 Hsp20 family protein [Methanoculleus sp.]MDD4471233.1 Hsp20 family protein [Methanoculleus sp.]
MAWRGSARGPWSEIEDTIAGMQRQFSEVMERLSGAAQQAPFVGGAGATVDVVEHESDVVVVADLPGVEREGITVRLLDARTLRIAARREEAREEEQAGYHLRERRVGAIARTVTLPTDVRDEEARATFKNGVLEVRLKKVAEARGKEIPLSGEAGRSLAETHRQQVEEEYREDREKMKSSGYLSSRELEQAAQKVTIPETGSAEEQKKAADLRRQKERMYEEGRKRLAG